MSLLNMGPSRATGQIRCLKLQVAGFLASKSLWGVERQKYNRKENSEMLSWKDRNHVRILINI